jgi:hypothetical protein
VTRVLLIGAAGLASAAPLGRRGVPAIGFHDPLFGRSRALSCESRPIARAVGEAAAGTTREIA